MDIIQMLALAEREQHTALARMRGHLASESGKQATAAAEDDLDLDLEQIPHFLNPDYHRRETWKQSTRRGLGRLRLN